MEFDLWAMTKRNLCRYIPAYYGKHFSKKNAIEKFSQLYSQCSNLIVDINNTTVIEL